MTEQIFITDIVEATRKMRKLGWLPKEDDREKVKFD
jgi:hypothetical protein